MHQADCGEDSPHIETNRICGDLSSAVDVESHIDKLTRTEVSGWSWMPSSPDQSVEIEALVGDRVIGRATANLPHPELVASRKGSGLYGFRLLFDAPLTGAVPPLVRALVPAPLDLSGKVPLPPLELEPAGSRARDSLRMLLNDHIRFTNPGPEFQEFDPTILQQIDPRGEVRFPLLLAFYLPQFHSIPENDRFWGRGFTEWRQLPKGIPRFPGHYQPRIPRDLGFYDLTSAATLRAQVNLARAAGIGGFGFYYYWFDRRRVLEAPLELFMETDLDMPFIIIWANENWTRTWDGWTSGVLLGQNYKKEDERFLLDDIARHLVHKRYITLDGRPLFVIYNPGNIPDAAAMISRWRAGLSSRCGVTPLMFMAQTFGATEPLAYGLDGVLEFPPHNVSHLVSAARARPDAYSEAFAGRVIKYDDVMNYSINEQEPEFPLIKTVVPSWDNDVRRPNRGLTLDASSPTKYENWLKSLILRSISKPIFGTSMVAINAWNEWAEGAYLEPDVYYGASFLNATARAYVSATSVAKAGRE